jgi:hypothetical protein
MSIVANALRNRAGSGGAGRELISLLGERLSRHLSNLDQLLQDVRSCPVLLLRVLLGFAGSRLHSILRGVALDDDDRVRRAVIGRLMCEGEVDLHRIGVEHGIDEQRYFERELAAIEGLGELATYDSGTRTLRTTASGRLLVRNICMVFDRYHHVAGAGDSRSRFSPTI